MYCTQFRATRPGRLRAEAFWQNEANSPESGELHGISRDPAKSRAIPPRLAITHTSAPSPRDGQTDVKRARRSPTRRAAARDRQVRRRERRRLAVSRSRMVAITAAPTAS
jgi:hypothetical protein